MKQPHTYTEIGSKVREARRILGWNQETLAEKAGGLQTQTVGRLERGGVVLMRTFRQIVAAINKELIKIGESPRRFDYIPDTLTVSTLDSLHGYWLETIDCESGPEFSIGCFHKHEGVRKYDGWSYDRDGNFKYEWNSFVFEHDMQHNRIIYSYDYGNERGDGFGAIQLRLGRGRMLTASHAYFIGVTGDKAILRHLKMERLEESMKRHKWKKLDVDDERNRVSFIKRLSKDSLK